MNNNKAISDVETWSAEEFGSSQLGNAARVQRLIKMGAQAANSPGGKITEVFTTSGEREGAYKFLESRHINGKDIGNASHIACATRCMNEPFVFVSVDGSSLVFADPKKNKVGLGPISTKANAHRGMQVMNAIAVSKEGTPMGICGQVFWSREEKPHKPSKKNRNFHEKETRFWFEAIQQTLEAFILARSNCIPWYQLDRGADFRELFAWAAKTDVYVTVRAAQDRRLIDDEVKYLWQTLEEEKPMGRYEISIPGNHGRKARQATIEVNSTTVTFNVRGPMDTKDQPATLNAVYCHEVDTTPDGEEPIEWLLLTNYAVKDFGDACVVIYGYTQRWRVEEFHKTWKSICKIEESLLEEDSRLMKWSIILAAVAMRIERIKYLARTTPEAPASVEFTLDEIEVIATLRKPTGYKSGDMPSLGLVVRWLADLGGYVGKSSGGPPGSIVIGRGLKKVSAALELFMIMRKN